MPCIHMHDVYTQATKTMRATWRDVMALYDPLRLR